MVMTSMEEQWQFVRWEKRYKERMSNTVGHYGPANIDIKELSPVVTKIFRLEAVEKECLNLANIFLFHKRRN